MVEKLANNLKYLDLSKKNPEEVFDSIIKKIPDLCLPPAIRLAGEKDFFNETKNIKLITFRKQQVFEAFINQDPKSPSGPLSTQNYAPTYDDLSCTTEVKPGLDQKTKSLVKVSFSAKQDKGEGTFRGKDTQEQQRSGSKQSSSRKILEVKKRIQQRYSKLKVIKSTKSIETNNRAGFDRILRKKPNPDYPFSSPMPSCMLTDTNIDNLREIIVSSMDIEWKMLTPVRPETDYDERYFDKLINLHRARYKTRLDSGFFSYEHQKVPFRHTRHSFILQQEVTHKVKSSLSLGFMLKRNLRRQRLKSSTKRNSSTTRLKIPTLLLTSEDQSDEPIGLKQTEDVADEDRTSNDDDCGYEKYTRSFHKIRENLVQKQLESGEDLSGESSIAASPENDGSDVTLDNQVEDIMNHLMEGRG